LRREEEGEDLACKVKEIEKRLDIYDREERRRNVVIRGMLVGEGGRRKAVKEIIKIVKAKVDIKEIKRIGGLMENFGRKMLLIKLGNKKQKREVLGKKRNVKGRVERISKDL